MMSSCASRWRKRGERGSAATNRRSKKTRRRRATRPHLLTTHPPTHPGNGLHTLTALDPTLGAAIESRLLPDGPVRQYDPADPTRLLLDRPSATGIFDRWCRRVGHFPWHELVDALAAGLSPGVVRLGHVVEGVVDRDPDGADAGTGCVTVTSSLPDGTTHTLTARLVVGCDGNQSAVRTAATGDASPPNFLGMAVWRGQCAAPDDWAHHANLLTGFARADQLFLVVDLQREIDANGVRARGGRLAWQAMAPWPADKLGDLKSTRYTDAAATYTADTAKRDRALATYADYPAVALDLVKASDPSTITEHGQFYRMASDCRVWGRGRVTLAGDAAHLMTPFLGQGTNQALEDAVELARCIGQHGATPAALREYERVRVPAATRVQEGSVGIAKSMASGGRISEVEWYTANPDVLSHAPEPLVVV